jgi:hypothetical protein
MRLEAVEEMPRHRAIIGVDLEPRINEPKSGSWLRLSAV